MLRGILTLLMALAMLPVQARTATARIERIEVAGVVLEEVQVRLAWPDAADAGVLRIQAARIDAASLGARYRQVQWQCPLSRAQAGAQHWRCAGPLQARGLADAQLAVDLSPATTAASLNRGTARLALLREASSPDATRLRLEQVPVAWAQALLAQAWPEGRLTGGRASGTLRLQTPSSRPLQLTGQVDLAQLGVESADGTVAAADVAGRVNVEYRQAVGGALVALDAVLHAGEALLGNAYVQVGAQPLQLGLDARQHDGGWDLPRLTWDDGRTLAAQGTAALDPGGGVHALDLDLRSADLAQLPGRYLSGWLGLAGLGGLELGGGLRAQLTLRDGVLQGLDATLDAVDVEDPQRRFQLQGLAGGLRHARQGPVDSELHWQRGALHGLEFASVRLPLRSEGGVLSLRSPAGLSLLGGQLRLDHLHVQPPADGETLQVGFGLELEAIDLGQLARALGWPAFRGRLDGRIPEARYAGERLDFDGGLVVDVFDGRVAIEALSMERPFGVAPTLSADVSLHDLDLLGITEVFDFGSISGRLHGRIDGLRLVDWTATAFDAQLHTEPRAGVRQRISQRAVQDISSVGDASFVTSLQGRLIGLFDDFGYRRIGIGCRLGNGICRMSGLHSAGDGFTIVEGAGVPTLQVVGFNRDVDWPTLLERLSAVAAGEIAPVVE